MVKLTLKPGVTPRGLNLKCALHESDLSEKPFPISGEDNSIWTLVLFVSFESWSRAHTGQSVYNVIN